MEAAKNCLKMQFFYLVLLWCKIRKKGECSAPLWSFNFQSKLIPAANCVRFCLNLFCHEVPGLYSKHVPIVPVLVESWSGQVNSRPWWPDWPSSRKITFKCSTGFSLQKNFQGSL